MFKTVHLYPKHTITIQGTRIKIDDDVELSDDFEHLRTEGRWTRQQEYIGMTYDDYMRDLATRVSRHHQIRNDRGQLVGFWDNREIRKYSTESNRITFKKPIMNQQELLEAA